ncbi:hypothetical protein [Luteolibacter sp. LG18]|uniref:hypothetical protein n=1 Tax=Luteolibacter sp. LG18 TaxID=2819286 RepID=UPI002B2F8054|nr:hypothetical protein llg_07330 [Luteolibacter sp. LG18]BCU79638.1 hypothetical protein llg_43530 [Luteolibacter sp. LG18]
MKTDLPTTAAASALFDAWSETLETHAHLLGREKDKTIASIRRTEAHIGRSLAALGDLRSQLEAQQTKP